MGDHWSGAMSVTTQGPTYPPSEVMDQFGNFVVIGRINRPTADGGVTSEWGSAIVAADSPIPPFGQNVPYRIVRELPTLSGPADRDMVLYTLPLPLPCDNYPMVFAPQQCPESHGVVRPSYPLHEVPIPDLRPEDGRKVTQPVTLGQWVQASGVVEAKVTADGRAAEFRCEMTGMIPDSLYTIMSLRERDLDQAAPTRPGPLGVPNVFVTDAAGNGTYHATLPNPFAAPGTPGANRIVNVVVLWMSYQQNYGGAIGWFGLGGDIHAQLKLARPGFQGLVTKQ